MVLRSNERDLNLWSIEDAAEAAGVTRQRLNELLRLGRYPCVVVPYRETNGKIKEDAPRRIRLRLIPGDIIDRIKRERGEAREKQAEAEAEAAKRRREAAMKRAARTPLLDAVKRGDPVPGIDDLPI